MIRNSFIALALACLLTMMFFSGLAGVVLLINRAVAPNAQADTRVDIQGANHETADRVAMAIRALGLPHVHVEAKTKTISQIWIALVENLPAATFGLFLTSGVVFVVFRDICRCMKIEPRL